MGSFPFSKFSAVQLTQESLKVNYHPKFRGAHRNHHSFILYVNQGLKSIVINKQNVNKL